MQRDTNVIFRHVCILDARHYTLKSLLVTFLTKVLTLKCLKFVQHKFLPDVEFQCIKYSDRTMWRSSKSGRLGEFWINGLIAI